MGMLQGWQITVIMSIVAVALIITVVVLLARIAASKRSDRRPEPDDTQRRN
ncbi:MULTISPECIES: hypothetical protein [Micrococcaceae]|uniref:hypothetical protein n=1 Tax=Micrococcaceae TaxID=1268 RepID=UPI001610487E|nr:MULTISPECIES: hypothetical protein [Micrococcaceae]MBB5749930.1 putative membrane protein [Micrococcus sp. TA1]HRO31247.1 hypothetical protein [Citricoccus sp.]HRO93213.1 hypothetical protein [Citricoccus sp.]